MFKVFKKLNWLGCAVLEIKTRDCACLPNLCSRGLSFFEELIP